MITIVTKTRKEKINHFGGKKMKKKLLSTFQLINKILKDNNLTLEKKCVNTPKEKEKDGIELLIDNLNKVKDAV